MPTIDKRYELELVIRFADGEDERYYMQPSARLAYHWQNFNDRPIIEISVRATSRDY